jgi:hypothetical protein
MGESKYPELNAIAPGTFVLFTDYGSWKIEKPFDGRPAIYICWNQFILAILDTGDSIPDTIEAGRRLHFSTSKRRSIEVIPEADSGLRSFEYCQ